MAEGVDGCQATHFFFVMRTASAEQNAVEVIQPPLGIRPHPIFRRRG